MRIRSLTKLASCNGAMNAMTEFWEEAYKTNQAAWGYEPSKSALYTKEFFLQNGVKNVLIPGIGYGRNAKTFMDAGIDVTGIEISKTAIDMASKHYGKEMKTLHASVTDMPLDENKYDGIFCYDFLHLLGCNERTKFIRDCYNQLSENGHMIFTVFTKEHPKYGEGKLISPDYYEVHVGARIFFYDKETVQAEFAGAGLCAIIDVKEYEPLFLIQCQRRSSVN
jgi:SAM-dependent methyltransferase